MIFMMFFLKGLILSSVMHLCMSLVDRQLVNALVTRSNCVVIGTGVVPPYDKCVGCVVAEAMSCVDDMRKNITGTVPPKCPMQSVLEAYDKSCCPVYVTPKKNKKIVEVVYGTSAYPSVLSCLRKVKCEFTEIYTEIMDECLASCAASSPYSGLFTCTALTSASDIPRTRVLLILFTTLISALILA